MPQNENVMLKYHGTIYRIPKLPFESQEQAMDRLWYIAKTISAPEDFNKVYLKSLTWVHEKYLSVKYD